MSAKKEYEIKQIMPGTGWFALIRTDDEVYAWPLVAWALVEVKAIGRIIPDDLQQEIMGMWACHNRLELCDDEDFVGYKHEDELRESGIKRIYDPEEEKQG